MKLLYVLLVFFIFFIPNTIFGSGRMETESQSTNDAVIVKSPSQLAMKDQYEAGLWIVHPSNNKLTIIGVSNPLMQRQDEIAAAREDAARKVAMYFWIQGRIETVNNTGTNFLEYLNDSNIELLYDTELEKYKNQLTFDSENDVLITREAVFVRFQYAEAVAEINYSASFVNGRPSWIRNSEKPEFEGYITEVGFSRNQRRLKDTIIKSANDAAVRMIESLSTTVNVNDKSLNGQSSSSVIHTVSEGMLYCFQVIEFWIEPETGYVYSLAIARRVS